MRILKNLATIGVLTFTSVFGQLCENMALTTSCITFLIGQGTGCDWMCNYCASQLNSSSYYFIPSVCAYQGGGCVGNPQAGVSYSCCTTV